RAVARAWLDCRPPHVMTVSLFRARASPSKSSSLRTLFPASAPPVASSRLIHRSTPSIASSAARLTMGVGRGTSGTRGGRGRSSIARASAPLCEGHELRVSLDRGAGRDVHFGHGAGDASAHLVLHLHRLEDEQSVPDLPDVALGDEDFDHAAGHGALHRLVAAVRGG